MGKIVSILVLSTLLLPVFAQQDQEEILESVRQNNTILKALREKAQAEKIGNKAGLNPENPEIEFGYLWASPTNEGDRKDLSITQKFDFPLAYRYKTQLSRGLNRQVDLAFDAEESAIIQEARLLCIELTHRNLWGRELAIRLSGAEELAAGYETLFANGEINLIEYNKTRLNLLQIRKENEVNHIEAAALSARLEAMNGGMPVSAELLLAYPQYVLPTDISSWSFLAEDRNPSLRAAEQSIALSRKQEQLTKALNLPKLSAGYVSERIPGLTQQGISIGVTVPLWENRNTLRHRKAQTIATQARHDDARMQFLNAVNSSYARAVKLQIVLKDYNDLLKSSNNEALLTKAFRLGELTLIAYLTELAAYYDAVDQYLETEKEYQIALAELRQWE